MCLLVPISAPCFLGTCGGAPRFSLGGHRAALPLLKPSEWNLLCLGVCCSYRAFPSAGIPAATLGTSTTHLLIQASACSPCKRRSDPKHSRNNQGTALPPCHSSFFVGSQLEATHPAGAGLLPCAGWHQGLMNPVYRRWGLWADSPGSCAGHLCKLLIRGFQEC